MTLNPRSAESMPLTGVWDCHVHCYPEWLARDPKAFASQQGEPYWLDLVTNGPQGWADCDELIRSMDRDGVDKAVLLGWYWQNPGSSRLQNEWYAQYVKQFPDRLMAFASVHPDDPDIIDQLKRAQDWGTCGIGECFPAVQSDDGWQHPQWEKIINWTTSNNWPINLHVTEPVGHLYPGRTETPLTELVEIFEKYPDQRWICAHWGGGLPFYIMNRRVKKALRNVWFDSAASPLIYSQDIWRVVCGVLGSDRVIFGSDFPLRLYPGKQKTPGWDGILEELRDSGLSADDLSAITRSNLRHLLSLRA